MAKVVALASLLPGAGNIRPAVISPSCPADRETAVCITADDSRGLPGNVYGFHISQEEGVQRARFTTGDFLALRFTSNIE